MTLVQIGGQRWKIKLVHPGNCHLIGDGGAPLHGCCELAKCTIYISKALCEDAREDTLLHELLHAVVYVTGAGEAAFAGVPAIEEALVGTLTPTLHQVLRDFGFRFPRLT